MLQSESVSMNGGDLGIGFYRVQPFSQEIDVIVKVAALDGIIAPDSRHQKIAGQYAIQVFQKLSQQGSLAFAQRA